MIATKADFEPRSTDPLPNSRKVYAGGKMHPDIRIPLRDHARILKPSSFTRYNGEKGARAERIALSNTPS